MIDRTVNYCKLSHPEKRLFYLQKYYPETSMWNVAQSIVFKTIVDSKVLEKAIRLFVKNNQNMRIRVCETEAGPEQYIADYSETVEDIGMVEFSGAGAMNKMRDWADGESRKPFTCFIDGVLYKFFILKLDMPDGKRGGFYVNAHHIIVDGASLALITDKIIEYYERLSNGENSIEEEFPLYFDYLKYETDYLDSRDCVSDRDFWFEKFKTDIENLELRPVRVKDDFKVKRSYYKSPAGLSDKIYDYCEKNKISVYRFFMSVLYAYFSRLTMKDDIVIQSTHHGRPEEFMKTTGMFVSTVAARFNFDSDSNFKTLCDKFVPEFKEMLSRHRFPGDLLGAELRRLGRDPLNLFTLMLSQYIKSERTNDFDIMMHSGGESLSLLSFYLSYDATGRSGVDFFIDYRISAYRPDEIDDMAAHIYSLIEQFITDNGRKITSYDFLSEKEKRRLLYELNDTAAYYPREKTFCDLFDEQVEKTPDKRAVVYLDKSITYAGLNKKSAAIARRLRSLGVGRDDIAGIFADRSIEMFIGVIGIVRSGAAYMPIDTKYPPERIEFMLADSGSKVLLTQKHLVNRINFQGVVIDLDDESIYEDDFAGEKLENINKPGDLAYVIYTSGSTGRPKGTLIEHHSLLNFSCWYKNEHNITSEDKLSKHASFGFDVSISETFPPLLAGAEVHIISEDIKMSLGELNDYFEKNGITIGFFTTQLAEQFNENIDNRSLRILYAAGEKLRTFTPRGYNLYNGYGPTECTVYTTFFPVDKSYDNIPIGRPLANTKLYVVDRRGNLMPEGYAGELYVGGDCLARGYLNRADITSEKFIASPFSTGERVYKTGDLVRWLPDGNMEYFGRMDSQVKIRGFRIELGEIEIEIMKIKGVKNTAVTVVTDGGNKFLCAYLVAEESLTVEAIKEQISKTLPEFMIPSHFVRLVEMPVNASGKIDRKSLPAPRIVTAVSGGGDFEPPEGETEIKLARLWKEVLGLETVGVNDNFFKMGGHSLKAVILQAKIEKEFGCRPSIKKIFENPVLRDMALCVDAEISFLSGERADEAGGETAAAKNRSVSVALERAGYVKPENNVEERLVKVWREVLAVDGIGVEDDFNAIGGNSLKMISMQFKIEKEFGIRLPVKKLFESVTIRRMAGCLISEAGGKLAPYETPDGGEKDAVVSGGKVYCPVSSVQKRLYIVESMEGASAVYNIPFAVKITGKLDRLRFSEAIEKMVERHESLRTSFEVNDGEPVQVIHSAVRFKKIFQDAPDGLSDECISELIKPFDISCAPLMRVKLFKTGELEHVLFVNFHHIIFDGMSYEIFMRELFEIYEGRALSAEVPQYKDFCLWQKKFIQSKKYAQQEKIWLEMFSGDLPTLNMPADFTRPPRPGLEGSHIEFMADSELAARLKNFAASTGNTLYTLILAALNVLLARYSAQEDIIVGTPLLGRPTLESQNTLGMFVNTMPVRNYPAADKKFIDFLNEVRSNFLNIIDNQDYQLDSLIDRLALRRASGHNPLFDVIFVYQASQGIKEKKYGDLDVKPQEVHTGTAKFDLTLQAFEGEEELRFDLEYRKCLFKNDTIQRMAKHLLYILDQVCSESQTAIKDIELTPPAERKLLLYDFNDTAFEYDRNITIYEYFERTAALYADNTAVVFNGVSITYGRLNENANKLARKLIGAGVKTGDFVAQLADKSVEMITGLLAIMKAGACYVPLEVSYPSERIAFMLEDTAAAAVIGHRKNIDSLEYSGVKIAIDDNSIYEQAGGGENIGRTASPEDLAYVIYTSGSTGRPKGVMIEHHSLINLACCLIKEYNMSPADRFIQFVSICFDPSIGMEIFPALFTGGELHVIPPELRLLPVELNRYMQENKITFAIFPTQFYEQFAELTDNKSARFIFCGGDKLKTFHKKNYALINAYGPTEYTVMTTMFPV